MGNCLKSNNEDTSLIRGSDNHDSVHDPASSNEHPPPFSRSGGVQPEPHEGIPVYNPFPGISRPAGQQTDDEQVKIARRLGLISHLPTGKYDGISRKAKECVICMNEFTFGEQLRHLPCMHAYHKDCIDDWLMRSFTCPSCMEPVDAALLTTYQTG
uniref:RING-type domain-containing protein n=1 Tax=Arion vulgaris TaxID=1028688 RepID=A0A0B6YMR4_9EUPU